MKNDHLKLIIFGGTLMILGADSSIINWPFGNPAQLVVMIIALIISIVGLSKKDNGLETTIFGSMLLYFGGKAININLFSSIFLNDNPYLSTAFLANTVSFMVIFAGLILCILGFMLKNKIRSKHQKKHK